MNDWAWHDNMSADPYDDIPTPEGCRQMIIRFIVTMCAIIGLLAVIFIFRGCSSQKVIAETSDVQRTEREIIRDTIVKTEADSATIQALMECDSTNSVILRQLETQNGERIKPSAKITPKEDGTLMIQFDCKEDSLEHEIQVRDKIIEEMRNNVKVVEKEVVPRYYKNTSTGFWLLLVILIAAVGKYIYKIIMKVKIGGNL